METKKKSWMQALFAYAEGETRRLILSVVLSVLSVTLGLAPFFCMYRLICLFVAGMATASAIVRWCLLALAAWAGKILLFSLSTGTSHAMAYTILEALRLRLADRFLHAPLGNVENHTIGEIKSMMVDKIENLEPPLAHMIPEGAGHAVLPIVSIIALLCIDWQLALASLVTFPLSFICMGLTFKISGKNFEKFDQSSNYMNSTIVEYIEGIEVIKAFGRAGVSYEKYAAAITDFRTFVVKSLTSTFATMKLSFALFPSTLIGTLPVALALANSGRITAPQAVLAVMLPISMVGSLARLEVFSENMRQVKFPVGGLEEYLEMPELPEPAARAEISHMDV
ncbi:MAG: ABC transporter ATP-binding protein [Oscillibacter sp.]|nr:ABC transporter ATP-binding protein [Oscillibacter sp.]MDY5711586.1 ABC transporter ATP-binding protein [Oscillospiraceae bacterium]